jgi:hypothetical protein
MYFILIFGPPAVGKMAVGLELERDSGIKLFHNHATIELVLNFFEFGSPDFNRLVNDFRHQIFNAVSKSDLPGLAFTYVWDLDSDNDKAFVSEACSKFEAVGAEITLVELSADLDQRLLRNRSPERLEAKPSKRDIESSELNLMTLEENHRMNSNGESLNMPYRHSAIDTSSLTARQTAQLIMTKLGIPHVAA